jgi:hypothetical protein
MDTMARSLVQRFHVLLNLTTLDDPTRHHLVASIAAAAPTSALVAANPAMQASVAALATKDTALTQTNSAVVLDKQKLKTDIATEAVARNNLDGELRNLATLTENNAKSPADVQGLSFVYRPPTVATKLPPPVPTQINVKIPKTGHGKVIAVVEETGPIHYEYAAQSSPDPFGPTTWAALGVGHGKTRAVTGVSGTKVWVRFATVRGQLQSDWSTPVLITIP